MCLVTFSPICTRKRPTFIECAHAGVLGTAQSALCKLEVKETRKTDGRLKFCHAEAARNEFEDIIEERGIVDRLCAWSAMRGYLKEEGWEVVEVGRPTGRKLVVEDDSWKSLPSFGVALQSGRVQSAESLQFGKGEGQDEKAGRPELKLLKPDN